MKVLGINPSTLTEKKCQSISLDLYITWCFLYYINHEGKERSALMCLSIMILWVAKNLFNI